MSSADVMAGEPRRKELGQDEILPYLDWIMPMEYTYFGMEGTEDVKKYNSELKKPNSNKKVISILRGWICKRSEKCSRDETKKDMLQLLKASMIEAFSGSDGIAIFTYESLLSKIGIENLAPNSKSFGLIK